MSLQAPSSFPEVLRYRYPQDYLKWEPPEANLFCAGPLPSMGLPALQKEMLECLERTVRRALREKKINHSAMAVLLPRRDMPSFLFRQKFRMNQMCLLMIC